MLDRVLASANPDGMLFDEIDAATLAPRTTGLSDNWGYIYGAVYAYYQATGDSRYRDAVLRVLRALPRYPTTCGNRARQQPTCRSVRSTATPTRSRVRSTW